MRVGVTQDELVIFDILTRPSSALSPDERDLVKKVAKRMLDRIKELLVIDLRSKQRARASIMLCIEDDARHAARCLYKTNLPAEVLVDLPARLPIIPAGAAASVGSLC